MPKRKQTSATGRKGVNFTRDIVESHNSVFTEIPQDNDLGIDALIELIIEEEPIDCMVAVQIKSGASYFDSKKEECKIPVDGHFNYWSNYPLPVYGIVYIPEKKEAYWVDIKDYLKNSGNVSVIRFKPKTINKLTDENFDKIFIPLVRNKLPDFTFYECTSLFNSTHNDEFFIGLTCLFKKYADQNKTWDLFIEYIKIKDSDEIPFQLVNYLAHIPWHPDLFYANESYTEESKKYAKSLFEKLNSRDLTKLIELIDEDNLIARGTVGQSIESIISIIPNKLNLLKEIIEDEDIDLFKREIAAILYVYNNQGGLGDIIDFFNEEESWLVFEMAKMIKEDGKVYIY